MKAIFKLLALMVVLALYAPNMVLAQDGLCDGLRGAELGICRAYVAAGCYSGDIPSTAAACDSLTVAYYDVSGGEPPPWEVTCPCSEFLSNLPLVNWRPTIETIWFAEDNGVDGVTISDINPRPYALVIYVWEAEYGICEILSDDPYIYSHETIETPEEAEACAHYLWDLAQDHPEWWYDGGEFPDFEPSPTP